MREAVRRAERGFVDGDLGGGVIKQRIPRPNEGRSGGYRSIILYRSGERAFFVYGFAKNRRENVSRSELTDLRDLATIMLTLTDRELEAAIERDRLVEVNYDAEDL